MRLRQFLVAFLDVSSRKHCRHIISRVPHGEDMYCLTACSPRGVRRGVRRVLSSVAVRPRVPVISRVIGKAFDRRTGRRGSVSWSIALRVAPRKRVEVCRLRWRPRQSLASSREPSLAWRPVTAVAKRRQGGCRPEQQYTGIWPRNRS